MIELFERATRGEPPRERARLGVLAQVSLLLASSDDHVTILEKLTEIVVPALGDWCAVHVVDPVGELERITLRHADPNRVARAMLLARGSPADPTQRAALRIIATGPGVWNDAEQVAEETWQRDALRVLGMTSLLGVPLRVRGRIAGVLTLARAGECYDPDDLEFAEDLARRVAMLVDNAMLLREVQVREAALREEASRLETLNRIGQELAALHDLDEVVNKVAEAATALTGAEVGLCFTIADGETRYALCGATPDEAKAIAAQQRMLGERVLAGLPRIASTLAVPVRGRRGDVIGGIALGHSQPAAFDSRACRLVTGLASLTATATDSARLFREARELIAALEKSNRDLDQFAYVTSHDLRAPLRGIANLAQWIEEDSGSTLDARSRELLGLLRGRVRRLEDLIEGVLDYSRAGRVPDEPTSVDVNALVREVIELLAPPPGATLLVRPKLPTLRTTRVPLQQVFMNLVGNALKYHGRTIEIGAEPISDGWEFFVRDDGPGIAPRFHAQIWGLFRTLHSRDQVESTGIGLAIVRKIVEAHGGRAWIESAEGCGATFRFTWPSDPRPYRPWERGTNVAR